MIKQLTLAIGVGTLLVGCNASNDNDASETDTTPTTVVSAVPSPTVTPLATVAPTAEPTPDVTGKPNVTLTPTVEPTPDVTSAPTVEPTPDVTGKPTAEPTPDVTSTPKPTPVPFALGAIADQLVDEDDWKDIQIPVTGDGVELSFMAEQKVVNFDVNGKIVRVRPVANYHGDVMVTVTAIQGEARVSELFKLTVNPVNDLPTLLNGPRITLPENTQTNLTLQSSDVDGDAVTYEIVQQPENIAASIVNGSLLLTPNNGFTGVNTITIRLNDGREFNDEEVVLNVIAINDAPTFTIERYINVVAGSATEVPFTITDPDSSPVVTVSDQNTAQVVVTVDQFTNKLTVTPQEGFIGRSTFTLHINDKEHNQYVQLFADVSKQWTAFVSEKGLYRTDGSFDSITELGVFNGAPNNLLQTGDNLVYFSVADLNNERENLWYTDGTAEGTKQVAASIFLDMPRNLVEYNGKVYFTARTGRDASNKLTNEIWQVEGNNATRLVQHRYRSTSEFGNLFVHNDRLYFTAKDLDGLVGREVYYYDFGQKDVNLLKDINNGAADSVFDIGTIFLSWQNQVCFTASGIDSNYELWCSDGSSTGTKLTVDLNGLESSQSRGFTSVGDALYFVGNDGNHGIEMWKVENGRQTRLSNFNSDPTVNNGNSFSGRGMPLTNGFAVEGNILHFVANDGTSNNRYEFDTTLPLGLNNPLKLDAVHASASTIKVVNGTRVFVTEAGQLGGSNELGKIGRTLSNQLDSPVLTENQFAKNIINQTWLFSTTSNYVDFNPWRTGGVGEHSCNLLQSWCGQTIEF